VRRVLLTDGEVGAAHVVDIVLQVLLDRCIDFFGREEGVRLRHRVAI